MSISISVFLYVYLLFILIWLIFSIIALYHMIRYGQMGFISLLVILIYILVSVMILYTSYQYLSQIDWSAEITIFPGGIPFSLPKNF